MKPAVLTIRPASSADAERIWLWRNDTETRSNSLQTAEIPWAHHQSWFADRLADPASVWYIVEDADAGAVGHVRFERRADDAAEVHITVAPGHRGRGIGTAALQVTMGAAMEALNVHCIDALVKAGNVASLLAFERSGFVRDEGLTPDGLVRFRFRGTRA